MTSDVCKNCNARPATHNWSGERDSVAVALDWSLIARWCHTCVLTKQIEHAEACAARLPGLRASLAACTSEEGK